MFDCEQPDHAGGLAGEFLASAMEVHPNYPRLDQDRDAKLFRRVNESARATIDHTADMLPPLGFDRGDVAIWKLAALSAFTAALPIRRKTELAS